MRSKIIVSEDNSKTLLIPELNETYHSTKGAITEALHVFIKEGLQQFNEKELNIFELGFGTGLNALVTLSEAIKRKIKVNYHTIESRPLELELALEMDYLNELSVYDLKDEFTKMHLVGTSDPVKLNDHFEFSKHLKEIENHTLQSNFFDLIYFDAFGPKVQPELWEFKILQKMWDSLKKDGILVTYCAQGLFKRTLKEVGFKVEAIPGPPGKREMTRAVKIS